MSDQAQPEPLPDLAALFEEARRRREADEAEAAKVRAAKEVEFHQRLERMIGSREWNPGDGAGVKCGGCGRELVYNDALRIVHPAGECVPKQVAVTTRAPREDLMQRVRYTYNPGDAEDDD